MPKNKNNQSPVFTPEEPVKRFRHKILPLTIIVSAALSLAVLLGVYAGFASLTVWLSQQSLPSPFLAKDIGCGYSLSGYCYDGLSYAEAQANGLEFHQGACSEVYSCLIQRTLATDSSSGFFPPDSGLGCCITVYEDRITSFITGVDNCAGENQVYHPDPIRCGEGICLTTNDCPGSGNALCTFPLEGNQPNIIAFYECIEYICLPNILEICSEDCRFVQEYPEFTPRVPRCVPWLDNGLY